MASRTFDLNKIVVSGAVKKVFEQRNKTTNALWALKVYLDIGNGDQVGLTIPIDENSKGKTLTKAELEKSKSITITNGKVDHWTGKEGKTTYEVRAYPKDILLDVAVTTNLVVLGGKVTAVKEEASKFIMEIPYMASRGGNGKAPEYDNRQARIVLREGLTLPKQDSEVLVIGRLAVANNESKTMEIQADEVVTV